MSGDISNPCMKGSSLRPAVKQGSGVYNTTLLFHSDGISAVEHCAHFKVVMCLPHQHNIISMKKYFTREFL